MGEAYLYGTGGGKSDIPQVIGGALLPTTAKVNTIYISTTIAIGNVSFEAVEPESPVVGDVFVKLGEKGSAPITLSESNPLITIYPKAVSQWDGSVWQPYAGYVWNGSEWISIKLIS